MPVTVAVLVNPGVFKATEPGAKDRSNRSFECDSLGDANARFLLEELIPGDQGLNLTKDPRAGPSAETVPAASPRSTTAWEKPDAFRKVVSHIGSFTNIRGGYVYPALIRKSRRAQADPRLPPGWRERPRQSPRQLAACEPGHGAALKFAGYDYKFEFGDGGHSGKHGGSIFPDDALAVADGRE